MAPYSITYVCSSAILIITISHLCWWCGAPLRFSFALIMSNEIYGHQANRVIHGASNATAGTIEPSERIVMKGLCFITSFITRVAAETFIKPR